jgi:hypothetical protein
MGGRRQQPVKKVKPGILKTGVVVKKGKKGQGKNATIKDYKSKTPKL